MSGYDKHPDYGGPDVKWWEYIVWPVLVTILSFGFWWLVY